MRRSHLYICFFVYILLLFHYGTLAQSNFIPFTDRYDTTEPQRIITESNSDFIEVEYRFAGGYHYTRDVLSETYDLLFIEGFSKMAQVGKPAVPSHIDHIAVPEGAKIKIQIIDHDYRILEGFMIHPALEPARDTEGAGESPFVRDEIIYATDAFFPETHIEVLDVQVYKNVPLALLQIRPVLFNPVKKELKVTGKIVFRIEYEGGNGAAGSEKNTFRSNQMIRKAVLNPEMIPDGMQQSTTRSERKDYIIITHDEYLAAADTLAKWKSQKGYSVDIVSSSSWTSDQVKDSIHTRYNSWTPPPDYFVIIGDHSGSYAVPGQTETNPGGDYFATDLYYACMDGPYDYYPDMAHGRISVTSASQAMDVIQKIVNYERYPVTNSSFYSSGLNCAQYQDDGNDGYADRRFCHTSEEIRDYAISKGYSVERVYYTSSGNPTYYNNGYYSDGQLIPAELRDPGFDWGGGSSDITDAINEGKFFVFHRDHGYVGGSGWAHPYYTTSSIGSLTNGDMLPVVFSINCHTGEFRLSECFAEKFIRHSGGGAVGVVAAASYSYSGYNDGFSTGMIDAIWSDPGLIPDFGSGGISNPSLTPHGDIHTMGDVLNQGLIRMTETWGNNQYTFELFHYFGDPAQEIWTDEPEPITAIVPPHAGETSLPIAGSSCEDALVTAWCDEGLIGKTLLQNGSGVVTYPAQTDSTVIVVTITRHDYRPLICESVVVLNPVDPPVADFAGSPGNVLEGDTVSFIDLSLNAPVSWAWTFDGGDPASSQAQYPEITYTQVGSYQVSLLVANGNGSDDTVKTDYITVSPLPLPSADFTSDVTALNPGGTVSFSDLTTNSPNQWQWIFEGGTPSASNIQNPSVTYNSTGTYSVTLIATNLSGNDTIIKDDYISVELNYCSSQGNNCNYEWISQVDLNTFSHSSGADNYSDFTGLVIDVIHDSTYSVVLTPGYSSTVYTEYWRVWIDFNRDGDFMDPGEEVFSVNDQPDEVSGTITIPSLVSCTTRMRVSMKWGGSPSCCESFSYGEVEDYSICINGINPPVADFTADTTSVYEGDTVHFTDLSTNNPTAYSWSFTGGDPGYCSGYNPAVRYDTAGVFAVELIVSNQAGADTLVKPSCIQVKPLNVHLTNDTVNPGDDECVEAPDTLIIAGNEQPFVVENGASLSVVAGDEIRLKPGFISREGSYFHAFIDENGCVAVMNPEPVVADTYDDEQDADNMSDDLLLTGDNDQCTRIKVYPNPTSGKLTVLVHSQEQQQLCIQLFDFLGKPLQVLPFQDQRKIEIDLSSLPDGIYLIRCIHGETTKAVKVIKR